RAEVHYAEADATEVPDSQLSYFHRRSAVTGSRLTTTALLFVEAHAVTCVLDFRMSACYNKHGKHDRHIKYSGATEVDSRQPEPDPGTAGEPPWGLICDRKSLGRRD